MVETRVNVEEEDTYYYINLYKPTSSTSLRFYSGDVTLMA